MFRRVNLQESLRNVRRGSKEEAQILEKVRKILEENQKERDEVRKQISDTTDASSNRFQCSLLDGDRIYHINHIRKICIHYRLRFLSATMYKSGLPEEAITKVHRLNKLHNTRLEGFRIAAPGKAFRLENYDDPLLFAPIGHGYYYLIHKWGKDMSPLRKWLVLPLRNLFNFVMFCLFVSVVLTMLIPLNDLGRDVPMAGVIVFLFVFKSVVALLMYGFFMGGRKLSDSMWNSRYYNF